MVDPDMDTGYIQWDGSWSFVYYSGMTHRTVNDPRRGGGRPWPDRRHVHRLRGVDGGPRQVESLAVEGTVADFAGAATVDLTEDGFTVTPDYLGVETETGAAAVSIRIARSRTGAPFRRTGWTTTSAWVEPPSRSIGAGVFHQEADEADRRDLHGAHEIELAAPTGLASSDVTQTTASLAWDAVDSAKSYEVQHRAGAGEWVAVHDGARRLRCSPTSSRTRSTRSACVRSPAQADLFLGDGDRRDRGRVLARRRSRTR